jgi:large subunit ribosomal protein L1
MLTLVGSLLRLKPSSAKGLYIRSVALSSTMGPGVRLEPNEIARLANDYR